ncbi:acyl-CoA dehydrogenase family protein [Thermodesulfobacteriota bacterium]
MSRDIYSEKHHVFRNRFREYVEREVAPYLDAWEAEGIAPRSAWKQMGEQGFLCPWLEEEYGGIKAGFEYSVIINEELVRIGAMGFMVGLHADVVVPYIHAFGTEQQRRKWLPGAASGDTLMAVAMTEPNTGSDLQGISTRAVKDGDHWVINGQKTFISLGISSDLVIVACRTDPEARSAHQGISLIVVKEGTPGFEKSRKLEKMGLSISDTAELFFTDCRVPAGNLLGEENKGFQHLMQKLQQERLMCAIWAQVAIETILEMTVRHGKKHFDFGKPIGSRQRNTFKLAEIATEAELGRSFINDLIEEHIQGKDIVKKVSMAKWWTADTAIRVVDDCIQFHGANGAMGNHPMSRWSRDIRATSIYGGTDEIMKLIIGNMMGF